MKSWLKKVNIKVLHKILKLVSTILFLYSGAKAFNLQKTVCEIVTEDDIVIDDDDVLLHGLYKPAALFLREKKSFGKESGVVASQALDNPKAVSITLTRY